MRFVTLATAPLLVVSTTLAHSPLKRGIATDICANLDADLAFPDVDGKSYNAGHIHIDLCVSQVPMFVGHYNVTEAAAKVVGTDKVVATVIDMIKTVGLQCSYPPHAKSSPTSSDVCDFVCGDGFSAMPVNHPSSCICPPHLEECDGKCGHSLDCLTKPPPSRRQNEPKCADGLTMCGVPDGKSGQAYKCVDTSSDPHTCGGCIKPSPFGSPSTSGVNCNDIPGVDDVTCTNSRCIVHSCKSGFTVSSSKDKCIPVPREEAARGLPVSNAGQAIGGTGVIENVVYSKTGSGAGAGKVFGVDTALGATDQALSGSTAGTGVARDSL